MAVTGAILRSAAMIRRAYIAAVHDLIDTGQATLSRLPLNRMPALPLLWWASANKVLDG